MKQTLPSIATTTQRNALKKLFNFNIDLDNQTVSITNDPFELIVFDFETTGLDPVKDKIIQVSAIKFDCADGKFTEKDRLNLYINQPSYDEHKEVKTDEEFFQKYGRKKTMFDLLQVTNEFISKQPSEDDVFDKIYSFFGKKPILAGHNIRKFDCKFINILYANHGCVISSDDLDKLDTLDIAKDLIPKEEAPQIPDKDGKLKPTYKLEELVKMFGLDKTEENADESLVFHDAMNDVIADSRLLSTLVYMFAQRELEEANENVTKVPVEKERARVLNISFWEGHKGFSRIYVNALLRGAPASYYYDIRKKCWGERDEGLIVATDMDALFKDTFDLANVTSEEELARIKDSIQADSEFSKRYEGI